MIGKQLEKQLETIGRAVGNDWKSNLEAIGKGPKSDWKAKGILLENN